MTRRIMISAAAIGLSANIFGPDRAYKRLGGVQTIDGVLVVKTPAPPEKWPAGRVEEYEGYPVRWEQVTAG